MSGLAFSELSSLILQHHRSGAAGNGVEVVPVVCTDETIESPAAAVLSAAIEAEDGLTVRADTLAEGVEGSIDGIKEVVEGFPDPGDPEHGRLRIIADGAQVRAEFNDGGTAGGSTGNRNLAGAILAPFASRLRQAEIAMLSYDEASLDASAADAIWQLYCLHMDRFELGRLRTLVLACFTAKVIATRHFQKFNSAHYVISPDRVSCRRGWDVDKQVVRRLGEEAKGETLALFLGAGFSSSSQVEGEDLPMGNELRDRALRRLIGDFSDEDDAAQKFRRFCESRETLLAGETEMGPDEFKRALTLERALQLELAEVADDLGPTLAQFSKEVQAANESPGECLKVLKQLLEAGQRLILVTVNLDELIEHVCGDLVSPISGEAAFERAPEQLQAYLDGDDGPAPLLKLHGSLAEPETVIATVGSVAKGLPAIKTDCLDLILGADKNERRQLFYVGASMRDRDVLQHIGGRAYAERLEEWWVAPTPDRSVEGFIQDQREGPWRDIGLDFGPAGKCITLTADIFMGELRTALS